MLYHIAVNSNKYMKHVNLFCEQNAEINLQFYDFSFTINFNIIPRVPLDLLRGVFFFKV